MVLENFVDLDRQEVKTVERIRDKRISLLYVGRLTEKKGFIDLVNALVGLDTKMNLVLDVLGLAESNEAQDKLLKWISELDLDVEVKLHGMVSGSAKWQYFQRADLFVFPSHFENSPVVLKEAQAFGLPCLISNIDENIQIFRSVESSIQFQVGSVSALRDKLSELILDECLLKKLTEAAQTYFPPDERYAEKIIGEVIK